jgi:glycosyltransferase involved in cell wall biosynthesis
MIIVEKQRARLILAYKNFGANKGLSHIGLGVSAMQTARYLRERGYLVEVWPILGAGDLQAKLDNDRETQAVHRHVPISHVVISAPWIPTLDIQKLIAVNFDIEFAVNSHSNIGFLQADPNALRLLREDSQLEQQFSNFHVAGISARFVEWWERTYQTIMYWLPNLYPIDPCKIPHKMWSGSAGVLRIGCFGAIRPYKNVLTAAAAALEIAVRLRVDDLEFSVSGGREEGGTGTILAAIREMYSGVPRAHLVVNNWQSWPEFLRTVGAQDLLLQVSYSEGFNMVTADGVAMGVATVVSDAITWAPPQWIALSDSASDVANRGISLLHDPCAAQEGAKYLLKHDHAGFRSWVKFLRIRAQESVGPLLPPEV